MIEKDYGRCRWNYGDCAYIENCLGSPTPVVVTGLILNGIVAGSYHFLDRDNFIESSDFQESFL